MYIVIRKDPEIFKPLTYPNVVRGRYQISNYGNVYSNLSKRLLTPYSDTKGYKRVQLTCIKGLKGNSNFKIHRLVAWEFCEGRSNERNEVNHLDSDRSNNYYENLEWVSSKENSIHAFNDGKRSSKTGENNHLNKYTRDLIIFIKSLLLNKYKTIDIMNYFGYSQSSDNIRLASLISDIKKNKTWKHEKGSTTIDQYYIFIP